MSVFEIIMLLCFGAAWPVSILKSIRTKSTGGKSLAFLLVIVTGYLSGILHKVFYKPDFVIWLYVLNFLMVGCDAVLWVRNRSLEKKAAGVSRR